MKIRPKRFVAARDFTFARRTWRKGDLIPHGVTLRNLLRYGDQFVVSTKNSTPVEHPADPHQGEATEAAKEA